MTHSSSFFGPIALTLSLLALSGQVVACADSDAVAGAAGAAGSAGQAGEAGQAGSAGQAGNAGSASGQAGSGGAAGSGAGGGAGAAGGSAAGVAGSGGSGGNCVPDPTCYTPTAASGEESFVAKHNADIKTFEFTLPSDPEAGYVSVNVDGKDLFIDLRVKGAPDADPASNSGHNGDAFLIGDTVEKTATTLGFVGKPGVTYEAVIRAAGLVSPESGEVPVAFTWKLAPLVDCFEPNDTSMQARPVAFGKPVRPYMFAGYTSNDWPSLEAHRDYFEVTVDKAGKLRVSLQPTPAPMTLDVALASAPGESLASAYTLGEALTVEVDAQPGKYVFWTGPFSTLSYNSSLGECSHCAPYEMKAELEYADGSGKADESCAPGAGGAPPTCYTPTAASGEESFVAKHNADTRTFEFTLPSDPEAGYVSVNVDGKDLFIDLRVKGASDADPASNSGHNGDAFLIGDTVEKTATTLGFVGKPGVTYEAVIRAAGLVSPESGEVPVAFTWKLAPLVDCFEPNDTAMQARPIALGKPVQPFLFAGYTSNDWPSLEAHRDYFEVTVDKAGKLRVALQPTLAPMTLDVALASAPGESLASAYTLGEALTVEVDAQPGKYVFWTGPFSTLSYNSSLGECSHCAPYTVEASIE